MSLFWRSYNYKMNGRPSLNCTIQEVYTRCLKVPQSQNFELFVHCLSMWLFLSNTGLFSAMQCMNIFLFVGSLLLKNVLYEAQRKFVENCNNENIVFLECYQMLQILPVGERGRRSIILPPLDIYQMYKEPVPLLKYCNDG